MPKLTKKQSDAFRRNVLPKIRAARIGNALQETGAAITAYWVQQTERARCVEIARHVSWMNRHDKAERAANEIWDRIETGFKF